MIHMDYELMDKEVLCILDTRRIQRFMFRTNSFVGGSRLIAHILEDAIAFALRHIDTPLTDAEYDISNSPDAPVPYFEDENIKFQLLISAAGNAMFIARSGALAQKIIRKISRYYLDCGYSLTLTAAAVEKTNHLGHDIGRLYDKLDRVKASAAISEPLGALPVVMREVRTGLPVVAFDEKRRDYVSRSSEFRRRRVDAGKPVVEPSALHTTQGADGKEYWAAIHADGNNFGITIGSILQNSTDYAEGVRTRRQINQNIDSAYDRTFKKSLQDLVDFYVARGGNDGDFDREFFVTHRGGDDLNIIVNANLAFPFLRFFYRNLEGETLWETPKLKLPLYISSGVAIVTREFSYHQAIKVAEECCDSAKKEAKKKRNLRGGLAGNWIDYQVSDNPNEQDLDMFREMYAVTRDGIRLTLRPYCLDREADKEDFSFKKLLQRAQAIRALKLAPREIAIMRDSYGMGKVEFRHWLAGQKKKGIDLIKVLGNPLRLDSEKQPCATWFDAVELMDFLPQETEVL